MASKREAENGRHAEGERRRGKEEGKEEKEWREDGRE